MATAIASPAAAEPAGAPSVSDLLGMIPSGALEASSTIEEPAKEGVEPDAPESDDGQIETPEPVADETPDPEPEPETPEPAKEPAKPEAKTEPTEDVPEGVVKGKNRKGEEGYFATPERWEKIYGAYKETQKISTLLGEPLTEAAIKQTVAHADSWNDLRADILSGDKNLQGNVIGYLMQEMQQAQKNGETAVDPSVSFVDTLYSNLAKTDSAAYRTMRLRNTQDLAREIFEGAARSGDEAAAQGIQHVIRFLAGIGPNETNAAVVKAAADRMGLPFNLMDELPTLAQGSSPEAQLRRENAQLRAQINGRTGAPQQAESFSSWNGATTQAVNKSVMDGVILPALSTQKEAWAKAFPDGNEQFDLRVLKPLQAELDGVLAKDERFQSQVASLKEQARRAPSADVRKRIAEQIATLTTNRANLSIEAIKAKHVRFAAETVKQLSDSTHQRRSSAQQRAVPRGASAPVNRGLVPANEVTYKDGVFDPATAMADMKSKLTRLVG